MVKLRNTNSIIILIEITQLESENVHRFDLTKYRSTKIANGKCLSFTQHACSFKTRLFLQNIFKFSSTIVLLVSQ